GFEGNWRDISYVMWLDHMRDGLNGLMAYDFNDKEWKDSHRWAAYVILSVVYEAGEDCLSIEKIINADGQEDVSIVLDESKIDSVALPAVSEFLRLLQRCKHNANVDEAKRLFNKYIPGPEQKEWLMQLRSNVKTLDDMQLVQPNLVLTKGKVDLKDYQGNAEGVIQSVLDRY
ncbi:hypothetical protein PMAYCL1PPCAC_03115, partial [Pristionchus mayeri]